MQDPITSVLLDIYNPENNEDHDLHKNKLRIERVSNFILAQDVRQYTTEWTDTDGVVKETPRVA